MSFFLAACIERQTFSQSLFVMPAEWRIRVNQYTSPIKESWKTCTVTDVQGMTEICYLKKSFWIKEETRRWEGQVRASVYLLFLNADQNITWRPLLRLNLNCHRKTKDTVRRHVYLLIALWLNLDMKVEPWIAAGYL